MVMNCTCLSKWKENHLEDIHPSFFLFYIGCKTDDGHNLVVGRTLGEEEREDQPSSSRPVYDGSRLVSVSNSLLLCFL